MIKINLLPSKKKPAKKLTEFQKQMALGSLILIIAVGGMWFYYLSLSSKIQSLTTTKAVTEAKIREQDNMLKEVKTVEEERSKVKEKIGTIEQLKKNQGGLVHLLDEVSKALPNGVNLVALSEKNKQVDVEGTAFTNNDIVRFVDNLKGCPYFADVYLVESLQTTVDDCRYLQVQTAIRVQGSIMASFANNLAAKIQKIPTKTRMYGFGALILVLCGLFIYLFHIPMSTQIKQLDKDITGLQTKMRANDEKIRNLSELRAEVKTLEARLKILTEQLPPGSEVSGLLRQIQNLVSQSGLTLKLWRPDKRKPHESGLYEEIPINVELVGGYHDVGILYDRVSKMTRIVNMLNLKMSGATKNKAGGMDIKVTCTALTFAAVEKKPDAAPDKAAVKMSK